MPDPTNPTDNLNRMKLILKPEVFKQLESYVTQFDKESHVRKTLPSRRVDISEWLWGAPVTIPDTPEVQPGNDDEAVASTAIAIASSWFLDDQYKDRRELGDSIMLDFEIIFSLASHLEDIEVDWEAHDWLLVTEEIASKYLVISNTLRIELDADAMRNIVKAAIKNNAH